MMMNKETQIIKDEDIEAQLPRPVGYKILVALPEVEKTYQNTKVLKTDKEVHFDYVMSIIGLVIDVGDQAYKDKERFGDQPWCETGDYVMFRANSGTRFKVGGVEYRLMNDDSIEAVVNDPRGVARAI
jgi:co-chaperonin GroES (HSP10)